MAKQRVINTRFWDDDYVMELDPLGKLLFLYCITNPLTDLCGAYQITIKRMAFDTGLKPAKITDILARFEADEKIMHRDGWLVIRNFGKHQQGNSPNVKKGAERSLSSCPDWIKQTLSKGFYSVGIETALLPLGRTSRENLTEQLKPEPETTRADAPPDFIFPLKNLFDAFPDLNLMPAQAGMIEAAVKPEDAEAWSLTIDTYRANYNPATKTYLPEKVGNLLNVFRSMQAQIAKGTNGNGQRQSEREKSAERGTNAKLIIAELERVAAAEEVIPGPVHGSGAPQLITGQPAEPHGGRAS